jgi:hypothetical protein
MVTNRVKNAVVLFFSGCAIILGLLLFVYLIATALDRLMCFTSENTLTSEELEERRVASNLTREAGLAGMLSSERSRVFRAFFEKSSFPYQKPSEDDDDDIEAQKKKEDSEMELKDSSEMASKGVKEAKAQEDESESSVENEAEGGENSEGGVCAICLVEYGTSLL